MQLHAHFVTKPSVYRMIFYLKNMLFPFYASTGPELNYPIFSDVFFVHTLYKIVDSLFLYDQLKKKTNSN